MKKYSAVIFSLVLLSSLTLGACSKKTDNTVTSTSKISSTSTSTTTTSSSTTPQTTTTTSSAATTTSTVETKKVTPKKTGLDFSAIKKGDYQQLATAWKPVGFSSKKDFSPYELHPSKTDSLTITPEKITGSGITLQGTTLTDQNKSHPVSFKEEDNTLLITLKDSGTSAINWGITFYPKGVKSPYMLGNTPIEPTKNVIAIWTSNNSYTTVFTEQSEDTPATSSENKIPAASSKNVNPTALVNQDYTSLKGTWKNPTNGKTIEVTDEIMIKPKDNVGSIEKGVILANTEQDGYPEIISFHQLTNGYLLGSIGSFNPKFMVGFNPLALVPKGVKMNDLDDSDSTKDRIIRSGGQSGYQTDSYYRE